MVEIENDVKVHRAGGLQRSGKPQLSKKKNTERTKKAVHILRLAKATTFHIMESE
jgi:hypothetical protein